MAGKAKPLAGTAPAAAASAAGHAPAALVPTLIRMLTGMEGPDVSRVRDQELEVGVDVDGAEAWRLVFATFAELVVPA